MITRSVLAVLVLLSAGCMATSRNLYLPDGQAGFAVNCSGERLDWDSCHEKATVLCTTQAYRVVDQQEQHGQRTTVTTAGVYTVPTVSRSMLITCQEAS